MGDTMTIMPNPAEQRCRSVTGQERDHVCVLQEGHEGPHDFRRVGNGS